MWLEVRTAIVTLTQLLDEIDLPFIFEYVLTGVGLATIICSGSYMFYTVKEIHF